MRCLQERNKRSLGLNFEKFQHLMGGPRRGILQKTLRKNGWRPRDSQKQGEKEGCHRKQGKGTKGLMWLWYILVHFMGSQLLPSSRPCLLPSPLHGRCARAKLLSIRQVPTPASCMCNREKLCQPSHLQNVTEVLADGGHVICSLKQPLLVKLPPSFSP